MGQVETDALVVGGGPAGRRSTTTCWARLRALGRSSWRRTRSCCWPPGCTTATRTSGVDATAVLEALQLLRSSADVTLITGSRRGLSEDSLERLEHEGTQAGHVMAHELLPAPLHG